MPPFPPPVVAPVSAAPARQTPVPQVQQSAGLTPEARAFVERAATAAQSGPPLHTTPREWGDAAYARTGGYAAKAEVAHRYGGRLAPTDVDTTIRGGPASGNLGVTRIRPDGGVAVQVARQDPATLRATIPHEMTHVSMNLQETPAEHYRSIMPARDVRQVAAREGLPTREVQHLTAKPEMGAEYAQVINHWGAQHGLMAQNPAEAEELRTRFFADASTRDLRGTQPGGYGVPAIWDKVRTQKQLPRLMLQTVQATPQQKVAMMKLAAAVAGHARTTARGRQLVRPHVRTLRKIPHADARLAERTSIDPSVLARLRARLKGVTLPPGDAHVRLADGHTAALKQVAPGRHVVATVLHRKMHPRGADVTQHVTKDRAFMEKAASALTRRISIVDPNAGKKWAGSYFDVMFNGQTEPISRIAMRRSPEGLPNQIANMELPEEFRGTGLSRHIYGELAKRFPSKRLYSDATLTRGSQSIWEGLSHNPTLHVQRDSAAVPAALGQQAGWHGQAAAAHPAGKPIYSMEVPGVQLPGVRRFTKAAMLKRAMPRYAREMGRMLTSGAEESAGALQQFLRQDRPQQLGRNLLSRGSTAEPRLMWGPPQPGAKPTAFVDKFVPQQLSEQYKAEAHRLFAPGGAIPPSARAPVYGFADTSGGSVLRQQFIPGQRYIQATGQPLPPSMTRQMAARVGPQMTGPRETVFDNGTQQLWDLNQHGGNILQGRDHRLRVIDAMMNSPEERQHLATATQFLRSPQGQPAWRAAHQGFDARMPLQPLTGTARLQGGMAPPRPATGPLGAFPGQPTAPHPVDPHGMTASHSEVFGGTHLTPLPPLPMTTPYPRGRT